MLQACHPGGKLGGIGLDLGAAGIVYLHLRRGVVAAEPGAAGRDPLEPVDGLEDGGIIGEGLAVGVADDAALLDDDVGGAQDPPAFPLERVELGYLDGDGDVPLGVEGGAPGFDGALVVLFGDGLADAELRGDLSVGALLDAHGQDPRAPFGDCCSLGVPGPGHGSDVSRGQTFRPGRRSAGRW